MKLALSAFALLLAAASHAASWERLEGSHSGIKQQKAVAVQDSRQWEALWRQHDAGNAVPQVDFSKESVVAVFLGERPAAGVTVAVVVQQDPLDGSRLNVFYREVASGKSFSAAVICQPYAFVKVPRAATIGVEKDGQVSIPESARASRNPFDGRKMRAVIRNYSGLSFDGR